MLLRLESRRVTWQRLASSGLYQSWEMLSSGDIGWGLPGAGVFGWGDGIWSFPFLLLYVQPWDSGASMAMSSLHPSLNPAKLSDPRLESPKLWAKITLDCSWYFMIVMGHWIRYVVKARNNSAHSYSYIKKHEGGPTYRHAVVKPWANSGQSIPDLSSLRSVGCDLIVSPHLLGKLWGRWQTQLAASGNKEMWLTLFILKMYMDVFKGGTSQTSIHWNHGLDQ